MPLDMPATLPAVAEEWAAFLSRVSDVSPKEALDLRVADSFGLVTNSAFYPRGPERPAWYHACTDTSYVFAMEGCNNLFQGYATCNGYLGSGLGVSVNGPHPYFDDLSTLVLNAAASLNMLAGRTCYFSGHSLGGAVAIQCHRKVKLNTRGAALKTVTFGSPKAGTTDEMVQLERDIIVRWMTKEDPVPLVFPLVSDCPALLLSLSPASLRRTALFRQPPGGVQIDVDGNVSPQFFPQDAAVNATGNLAAWLLGLDQNPASPHALSSYQTRLATWVRNHPAQTHTQAVVARTQPEGQGQAPAELTRAERRVFQAFRDQEIAQREAKFIRPAARLVTVERVRPFYRVVWEGSVIAVVSGRRTAHAIARDLNHFLDRIQVAGVVDSEHITQAFTSYLAAAQAGGAFNPPMKTTLPPLPADLP